MDNAIPFLAFAAVGGGLAIGGILWVIGERKRRLQMEQVAKQMGMSFVADAGSSGGLPTDRFRLFSLGHGRRVRNLMQGTIEDLDMSLFDFQYTTGSGKSRRTTRQTVAMIRQPSQQLPDFEVRPEHLFHKIGAFLGLQDIDIPEYPTFSKRYVLRGADEESVRLVFGTPAVQLFEQRRGLSAAGGGEWIVVHRAGRRVRPDRLTSLIDEAFEVGTSLGA